MVPYFMCVVRRCESDQLKFLSLDGKIDERVQGTRIAISGK
jgi:hypothetical protein